MSLCFCGCGGSVKPGNTFLPGHNLKLWRTNASKEEKLKRCNKMKESIKLFYKNNPMVLIERGKKISLTKNTSEGKLISKRAYEKCKDEIISKLKGRLVWNKLPDSKKIKILCLNCSKEMLVVPFVARTKKYCSKGCLIEYRTGKPHLNWNPNSFHNKTGWGISGEYKGIRFRSSYELSFVKRMLDFNNKIVPEPFKIRLVDYLSPVIIEYYNIQNTKYYTPDYIVNDNFVVEIKPQNLLDTFEYLNEEAIYKMKALEKYCEPRNLTCNFITDDMMEEYLLSYADIKNLPKEHIIFYREKDNERFK